ncbi:hypothetical protein ANCDUO_21107, partial [Ancylostoma duodenale]
MGTPGTSSSSPGIRTGFPARTPSTNSLASEKSPQQVSALKTTSSLEPATRFALADLITSVLRLDFWDDAEPSSIYQKKVIRTLKTHLEGEESLPDIAALITTIKSDPLVSEDGTI